MYKIVVNGNILARSKSVLTINRIFAQLKAKDKKVARIVKG